MNKDEKKMKSQQEAITMLQRYPMDNLIILGHNKKNNLIGNIVLGDEVELIALLVDAMQSDPTIQELVKMSLGFSEKHPTAVADMKKEYDSNL